MARPFIKRRLLITLLVLGAAVLSCALAVARDVLHFSQNAPGDSKAIVLDADEISTWTDGSQRILMLKGRVLIEQGVVRSRMQQAVAWVDQENPRPPLPSLNLGEGKGGAVVHMEVYAEGDVLLESGPKTERGPKALLEFHTRGELKLKAHGGKVIQQARAQDPLYVRGLAERSSKPASELLQSSGASGQGSGVSGTERLPLSTATTDHSPLTTNPILPVQAQVSPPEPVRGAFPPTPPSGPAAAFSPQPDPLLGPIVPGPGAPPASPAPPAAQPTPAGIALPSTPRAAPAPERVFQIAPRTASGGIQQQTEILPGGEQALIVTGGVILTVRNVENRGLLDIEADRLVVWTRGNFQQLFERLRGPQGQRSRELEFYLAGNVEIREQTGPENRMLRAEQVYYDVSRNVAIAYQADLEFKQPGLPDPVHLKAQELQLLGPGNYRAIQAQVFSSRLPSDPGLVIYVTQATLEDKQVPKRSIFGRPYISRVTGQPETEQQRLFHGDNVVVKVEELPIFYFPFIQGDANDPLGPLRDLRFSYNRIFGFQFYTTWNMYDLIGMDPIPGTRWDLNADYLTKRGPALGTNFDYAGNNLFDIPGKYNGLTKLYGIYDTGKDILGGGRGENEHHTPWRGRLLERHRQELPDDFTLQFQISALSDKNFLEQYYKDEFDRDINQETFIYLKQQRDNWAWTVLTEPRIRNWVTETEWLPRADGYLIGQSFDLPFLDLFSYNAHASAGYAQLRTPNKPPPPVDLTDRPDSTGRFDLWQELSLPFTLGPVRLVPYLVGDLTYYTEDLTGSDRGRVYEAAGLRTSMPLSRLYPDVCSELFNLNGINHKIVLSGNFYAAHSDTPFTRLPQLDRLDDDATDQARRDIKPLEPAFNPQHGVFLATSPLFDPQLYAIRRLVDDRIDTLDSVEVLQMDIRQRWQTKRGYPGNQHIVDWMTLDMSASYFPRAQRDNFGENFAFLEYDWTWNIGDRTALVSTGWFDPIDNGARVFTIGAFLNRPDRTNFYVGYRQIDPIGSQAVTGAVTYVFSPKYAMTASSTYDFGTQTSLSNTLVLTRMGSDLQFNLGITYNAILNNFGVVAEILPNAVATNRRIAGLPAFGSSLLGR